MLRHLLMVNCLTLAGAICATAQTPAAARHAPDSAVAAITGTWEGPYTSDHAPPGSLRIVITRDTSWHATMAITAQMPIPVGSLTEFRVQGRRVSWNQVIMDMTCSGEGAEAQGELRGLIRCGPMELPFILRKRKQADNVR